MLRKILFFDLILISMFSICCFAKNINLFDQPKNDAKVIGTIDPEAGLVPIFTAPAGNWLKVGDPRNGNVGWVKSSDLNTTGSGFSFTQEITNTGKGPQQYIVKFNSPKPLTQQQSAELVKRIQKQQAEFQKNIQELMQNIYRAWPMDAYPVFVPVAVEPQKNTPNNAVKQPAK